VSACPTSCRCSCSSPSSPAGPTATRLGSGHGLTRRGEPRAQEAVARQAPSLDGLAASPSRGQRQAARPPAPAVHCHDRHPGHDPVVRHTDWSTHAQRNCPSTYREVLGRQDSGKKRREIPPDTRKCNVQHALGVAGILIAASRVVFAPSAAQRLLNSSGLSKRSSCPEMPSSHSHNSNSPGPSHGSPSSGAGSVASSRISRRSPRLLRLGSPPSAGLCARPASSGSKLDPPNLGSCRIDTRPLANAAYANCLLFLLSRPGFPDGPVPCTCSVRPAGSQLATRSIISAAITVRLRCLLLGQCFFER
jgi:hypothetical protein